MVKEEGFTLNKYEELFFSTMDEEVIEDWNHKLPDHPKLPPKPVKKMKKQVKNISPSDDDDSSQGEGGGGSDEECYAVIGSSRACGKCSHERIFAIPCRVTYLLTHYERNCHVILYLMYNAASKKKGTAAAGKKRKAIKKKKKSSYTDEDYDFDSDGDDGVPGGDMRRLQRQIFDLCLDGRDKFDTFDKSRSSQSRPTSFKGFASESAKAMNNILLGTSDNAEMAKYKLMQMNPIYKKSVAEVDEYVAREAAALKKDLMEALLLDKFTLSDEEGEEENEEDASGCGGAGVNNKEEDYEMVEKEEAAAEKDDDDNKEVITEDDEMVDSSEGGGEVEDGKGSSDDDDNESS